jgi:arylsulfatase A-like enzyme
MQVSMKPQMVRLAAVFALFPLLVLSCRGEVVPSRTISLLGRAPDRTLEQRGEFTVEYGDFWGDTRPHGWEVEANPPLREEDPLHVWSRRTEAHLNLSAGPPADRVIELVLLGPPAGEETEGPEVVASLNGIEIGRFELTSAPREFRVEAPAPLWREGSNLLGLETDRLGELRPGFEVGLALASLRYDAPRRVTVGSEPEEITLQPGTGLDYWVEVFETTRIGLEGTASAAGRLSVRVFRVAPESGRDRELEMEIDAVVRRGPVERDFALPEAGDDIFRLEIRWIDEGESGGEFRLGRLDRIDTPAPELVPIIYVAIDTLAAQNLQLYGYPRETAPHLEEFAREAVLFERCACNAPWTVPSFMSSMTGLYPNAHWIEPDPSIQGMWEIWDYWHLAENRWTMAEMLRASGYQTAGIVDSGWLVERFGFPQGFEHYDDAPGQILKIDPEGGIRMVSDLSRQWLDTANLEQPFFLFFHVFDVHNPYTPTEGFKGRFRNDALWDEGRTARAHGAINCYGVIPDFVARGEIPEGEIPDHLKTTPFRSAYDEGVAMVDHELHLFFEHLKSIGVYDRALIIVTADHGETMDETEFYFGHGILDEPVTHVPLLIRLPGGRHGGRRIPEAVQLVDLYPTILDYVKPGVERYHLHGRSLRPILEGETLPPAPAYTEGGIFRQSSIVVENWKLVEIYLGEDEGAAILLSRIDLLELLEERVLPALLSGDIRVGSNPPPTAEQIALFSLDSEFMRRLFSGLEETGMTTELFDELRAYPGFYGFMEYLRAGLRIPTLELYDIIADPLQRNDLAASKPEKVQELLPLLQRQQKRRERARSHAELPATPVTMSSAEIKHLQAIGYADGGSDDD